MDKPTEKEIRELMEEAFGEADKNDDNLAQKRFCETVAVVCGWFLGEDDKPEL